MQMMCLWVVAVVSVWKQSWKMLYTTNLKVVSACGCGIGNLEKNIDNQSGPKRLLLVTFKFSRLGLITGLVHVGRYKEWRFMYFFQDAEIEITGISYFCISLSINYVQSTNSHTNKELEFFIDDWLFLLSGSSIMGLSLQNKVPLIMTSFCFWHP